MAACFSTVAAGAPRRRAWSAVLALAAGACGSETAPPPPPVVDPEPQPVDVPALGTSATLDVATWNLLNFGAARAGPPDERLQRARVRDVILGTDADIWGVQEVTSASAFAALLEELPGYGGLLADDAAVEGGSDFYDAGEIKVGLIYKTAVLDTVLGARVALGELNDDFAGRPPLEVRARLAWSQARHDVVILVLHAKANQEVASWERRRAAAAGLHEYLEDTWPDALVLVPGDWNDDLDESITAGRDTPYRVLLDAAPDWRFPTETLGAGGATSILGYDDVIDHVLASDEFMAWYVEGSAQIHQVDQHVPEYRDTTSDHLPVLVQFRLGGQARRRPGREGRARVAPRAGRAGRNAGATGAAAPAMSVRRGGTPSCRQEYR